MRDKVIKYVMERHCRMGGFCFYRLEEPNGLDTCCALSVLKLLNIPFHDERTVSYLQAMQHEDGSYDNVFISFYSLKSLLMMKERPAYDPWPYIQDHIQKDRVFADKLPVEVTSIFRKMKCLLDLYKIYQNKTDEFFESRLIRFILGFQNDDGGFGYPRSSLGETSKALTMLRGLSYPPVDLQTSSFVRRCEIPNYGFTNMPGSSLSFMEYIHEGLLALRVLNYKPQYASHCIEFIKNCQNINGGFSRTTHTGIATLENTFYAVSALKFLSAL